MASPTHCFKVFAASFPVFKCERDESLGFCYAWVKEGKKQGKRQEREERSPVEDKGTKQGSKWLWFREDIKSILLLCNGYSYPLNHHREKKREDRRSGRPFIFAWESKKEGTSGRDQSEEGVRKEKKLIHEITWRKGQKLATSKIKGDALLLLLLDAND